MNHKSLWLLALACFLGSQSSYVAAKPAGKPAIGQTVANFSLQDFRGSEWSLQVLHDKPVVVIAFLGTECPLVQQYTHRLAELSIKYKDSGVAFVGINANQQDSLAEIAHFVKTHELEFPMLKDAGNRVADQLGAARTPEVFVLDAERRVCYHGRIDDQYTYGVQRLKAEQNYLADAIDQVLAGKPVSLPETEVVGCFIGRVLPVQPDSEVTYSKQVSRIFNKRCVECHREGEIGPFALTNYAEAVGWSEMIAEVVREQRMPPWHADPAHGHFANDARLTDEEKETLFRWVRAGAPEGDPKDLPEPPKFVEGWRIGEPDMVVYMADEPFQVPAVGEVRYRHFVVDPGFKEDKWVKAAECRPGNREVVHHIIVAAGDPQAFSRGTDGLASDWLAATAPGARPMVLAPGMAKRVPAGSKLIFQLHYTPNGKAQEDRSCIGLVFADPSEVKREVVTQKASNNRFRIPPGDGNHRVESDYVFREESVLLSMFPHMHLRGKSFQYTVHYPDGKEEVLLDVPHYDFNWQNSYDLAEPKLMPAGTRIHCVAHFDNSTENWANPDPTATVRWGDQTWEEMMIGYFNMSPTRPISHESGKRVNRTAQFLKGLRDGQVPASNEFFELARQAASSQENWQAFASALRELAPQLDRADWMSVQEGRMTVQRVSPERSLGRVGGAGFSFPAVNMTLAEYAQGKEAVVHQKLGGVEGFDMQLLSRAFSSSCHIPAKKAEDPGVISFWSAEGEAFPPELVEFLRKVASEVTAGAK